MNTKEVKEQCSRYQVKKIMGRIFFQEAIFLLTDTVQFLNFSHFHSFLYRQLMNLSTLYTETELADYICPVALELAADKVAEVRQNAFHLVRVFIFPNISFYIRCIKLSATFLFFMN